jgi:hypothetical protein
VPNQIVNHQFSVHSSFNTPDIPFRLVVDESTIGCTTYNLIDSNCKEHVIGVVGCATELSFGSWESG